MYEKVCQNSDLEDVRILELRRRVNSGRNPSCRTLDRLGQSLVIVRPRAKLVEEVCEKGKVRQEAMRQIRNVQNKRRVRYSVRGLRVPLDLFRYNRRFDSSVRKSFDHYAVV